MKVPIGEHNDKPVRLDIEQLLRTRLLIQANSGGGKSYALRKFLEETHGKVQHLVIDPEGEFSTLREKFDYVLVGKGGDIHADVRTAPLLAERLLELNASAIIDLYELHQHQRIRFVKLFLDALVNVDKRLWHPALVVIDEAHIFCPEKGESEAMGSVIDICTRGRKRSFCAVLATQRLSKLHKDAAAECNNKLIGRTGLDIDLKRAAEELGITSKEEARELRKLEPGNFFAFGPAISLEVIPVKIGEVQTSHPDIGSKQAQVAPAPQEKIRKVLEKLGDLPKEAEQKQRTMEALQAEVKELKRQLRERPIGPAVDSKKLNEELDTRISRIRKEFERMLRTYCENTERALLNFNTETVQILAKRHRDFRLPDRPAWVTPAATVSPAPVRVPPALAPQRPAPAVPGDRKLGKCEHAIAAFLSANSGRPWSKEQVGMMIGYSPRSSMLDKSISNLSTAGVLNRQNGELQWVGGIDVDSSGYEFSVSNIRSKLGKCDLAIFDVLIAHPDREFDKSEIGERTGYSEKSSMLDKAMSRLSTMGVAVRSPGRIRLSDDVKELL